jgi:hypothetical protein
VKLQPEAAYWLAISVDEGEVAWMSAYPNLDPQEVTFAERARGTAWRVSKVQSGHGCRVVARNT